MSRKRILSPKNDYLFKRIFFDNADKNVILKKLLEDCIGFGQKQVEEITLVDRTGDKEFEDDKTIIFDVNAKLSDGTLVNVEIQKLNHFGFIERSIFYTSRRLSGQGVKGLQYGDLKQTVALNIVDFDLFNDTEDFYSTFYFSEKDRHTILSDLLRIDFLELKKLDLNNIDTTNKKELWVKFFNAESEEELDMLKEIDKTFEKPVEKLYFLSSDPSTLTAYEEREKVRMDEFAKLKYAEEKGKAEGQIEQKLLMAKKLLNKGFSDEDILELSELTREELNSLR
ncbi:MAG: Rpn family recombination-promoting nuclease/putative transposase [Lachnospirales bacterium]